MGSTKPSTAFIGLGAMGFGMANNLIREGYPVTGFDVWAPTLEKFKQAGGLTATSPAEAVAGKQFCVCMVATAEQAQSIIFEGDAALVKALPQEAVLLLCSTVPCGYVQGLQKELIEKGRGDIFLVDSPVSGGAARAAAGTLSIMAGGSEESISRGLHLLQAMSDPEKLYIVKGGIGAGSNMKMCHQVLAANQILSASEAMGFASHLGLDLPSTGEHVVKSEGWSWMHENRLPRILDPEFKPIASAVTIILKDTSIITSEARRAGFPTPMTSAAEQAYFTALGRGWGPDDDAALLRLYIEGKGKIGPVKPTVKAEEAKLKLVVNLLRGIHLCAAAEALAFAHFVGLDLEQVFELCTNAAGGSKISAHPKAINQV
ncbi:L-threonate dehydrogenase [Colletotrichum tropicale]|nr:L-threonate dehydrogenase [Colletotrichum tropicale]